MNHVWMMGTPFVHERRIVEALNNCAFISTERLAIEKGSAFAWAMNMLMLGVGVGFDTRGANTVRIKKPSGPVVLRTIKDSREGWARSVEYLVDSYIDSGYIPNFDYSEVRPKGSPITGFGGVASGPAPLIELHARITRFLDRRIGQKITSRDITDIFNAIGACVVAGNVRRSAELALGNANDKEFVGLKDYSWDSEQGSYIGPEAERSAWGWSSNNSILAYRGMNYDSFAHRLYENGEPGFVWMENVHEFGRIDGTNNYGDKDARGFNPCQPSFATVLTPEGVRTFADIEIGSAIWSGERWTTVTNKWSTGIKSVYRYHSTFGEFVGTENHRVVQDGEKIQVRYADAIDARAGEYIPISSHNPQDVIDGLVIGDGTLVRDRGYVLLCIGEKDTDYFDSEVSHLIGDQYDRYMYRISTTIKKEELGYTYDREVPYRFTEDNRKVVAGFLRGLFSANGTVTADGYRVSLKQTSYRLIRQAQLMLSSIGIRSYITTNKPKIVKHHNGEFTSRESYDLNISTDRFKFIESVGFIQEYKNKLVSHTEIKRNSTGIIQDVEYLGEHEVFDITVDDKEHTYWTGGLLVSNCAEQPLGHREMCTLAELPLNRASNKHEFLRGIKYAYMYAKTVTLMSDTIVDPISREVMKANRRIGTGVTGVAQFVGANGIDRLVDWLDHGYYHTLYYDRLYSQWLGINESNRHTTVKPSGTVSLVVGSTPGMHWNQSSRFHIRRMRLPQASDLLPAIEEAGFHIEPDAVSNDTMVVSFPVDAGPGVRSEDDVTVEEQLEMAALMQRVWSDNGVSVTVKYSREDTKPEDISRLLRTYEHKLKAVSFLAKENHGYTQAPYESIDQNQYEEFMRGITRMNLSKGTLDKAVDMYCEGVSCEIPQK